MILSGPSKDERGVLVIVMTSRQPNNSPSSSTSLSRVPGINKSHILQKKLHLEMDNSVSNPSRNGISEGLETEFSVLKTLVCGSLPSLIRL